MSEIKMLQALWMELWRMWRESGINNPLRPVSKEITRYEEAVKALAIILLNFEGAAEKELFSSAREVRDAFAGRKIITRASIDVSNVCRVRCDFCPMRLRDKDEPKNQTPVMRLTAKQILHRAQEAYQLGFREMFIQAGEDVTIVNPVAEAVRNLKSQHADCKVILNLGSLNAKQYKLLRESGGDGYLIKVETSHPTLHLTYRRESLPQRIRHTLLARETGFYIGSGIILGLPGQSDYHLASDLIHFGRLGADKMVSCSPFTRDDELSPGLRNHPSADIHKTMRFIAILRHFFPHARIPAPSNVDSKAMNLVHLGEKSGQSMLIDAGANGISVKFTPPKMEEVYGIYARGLERYIVHMAEAERVSQETGLPLDLVRSITA